jgi:Abnormal spindle-like microcephaly-assoc'd, ASPM-SPD-2-Hydin
LSAHTIDLGAVKLGNAKSLTFTVGNTGSVPLTINRAIAPLEPFNVTVALPEGISIEPRTRLIVKMSFRPTALGPVQGEYAITA